MANFQTHVTVAAAASITATAICIDSANINVAQAMVLLTLGTLSGMLPDIDSDNSVPTRLLFNALGFITASALIIVLSGKTNLIYRLAAAFLGALSIRFIAYPLFAKITRHRGLFHSVPAAGLFGLGTVFMMYTVFNLSLHFAWLAAAFVSGGYLVHLILDEIYSVDLLGTTLKKSFGSALTFFKFSAWRAYLILYALVAGGLLWLPMPNGEMLL